MRIQFNNPIISCEVSIELLQQCQTYVDVTTYAISSNKDLWYCPYPQAQQMWRFWTEYVPTRDVSRWQRDDIYQFYCCADYLNWPAVLQELTDCLRQFLHTAHSKFYIYAYESEAKKLKRMAEFSCEYRPEYIAQQIVEHLPQWLPDLTIQLIIHHNAQYYYERMMAIAKEIVTNMTDNIWQHKYADELLKIEQFTSQEFGENRLYVYKAVKIMGWSEYRDIIKFKLFSDINKLYTTEIKPKILANFQTRIKNNDPLIGFDYTERYYIWLPEQNNIALVEQIVNQIANIK